MDSLLLLLVCLLTGILLRRVTVFPPSAPVALNQFVIYISLPAMALFYIPKIVLGGRLLYPLGVAWMGFALSFLFFSALGKWLGWSRRLTGCLILMGGLGNTSFVGFPIVEALYGPNALKTAIVVDQPGSFMVMVTLGVIVATLYAHGNVRPAMLVRKIAVFPPFLGFAVGLVLNVLHADFPDMVQSVFQRLAMTVTPIALVAVGMQLKIKRRSRHFGLLTVGLLFKLVLTPLFFFTLYWLLLDARGMDIEVSIVEAAMAPMITAAVLATSHGLKPRLATMMIGIGIPVSILTVGIWFWLLTLLR